MCGHSMGMMMVIENSNSMEHELCLEQNKDCTDSAMCI